MAKLKLGIIADDKPVKLTVELPATIHSDLIAYGEILARQADRAHAGPVHVDGSGVCEGASGGVIDFWVTGPGISVAQVREDSLAPGRGCGATRGR